MKLRFTLAIALSLGWMMPHQAQAQMVNENILADMPKGYKVATQTRKNGVTQVEMIPQDQSTASWRDKFIVSIFHNSQLSIDGLEKQVVQRWFGVCPRAAYKPDGKGTENGYDFSFFLLICPELDGQPMSRIIKILRGRDSLYLTQAILKQELTRDVLDEWTPFMTKIGLCDTRVEEQACPPGL